MRFNMKYYEIRSWILDPPFWRQYECVCRWYLGSTPTGVSGIVWAVGQRCLSLSFFKWIRRFSKAVLMSWPCRTVACGLSCRQLRFHWIEAEAAYQADLQVQVLQGYCACHDALVTSNTLSTYEWVLYQDTSRARPVLPSMSFNSGCKPWKCWGEHGGCHDST